MGTYLQECLYLKDAVFIMSGHLISGLKEGKEAGISCEHRTHKLLQWQLREQMVLLILSLRLKTVVESCVCDCIIVM